MLEVGTAPDSFRAWPCAQHLLAVLRTPKVDTLTLTMATAAAPRLQLQLVCSKTGDSTPVLCLRLERDSHLANCSAVSHTPRHDQDL